MMTDLLFILLLAGFTLGCLRLGKFLEEVTK
jgi:hypothetical protein